MDPVPTEIDDGERDESLDDEEAEKHQANRGSHRGEQGCSAKDAPEVEGSNPPTGTNSAAIHHQRNR